MTCSVDGCDQSILARGMCSKHYQRWIKWGDTECRMKNWHSGSYQHEQGYVRVHVGDNKYKMEHVLKAEKARGRQLPPKAVVHHVNGDPADNDSPWNLVLCPDQKYHLLLHQRARALGYEPPEGFRLASKPKRKYMPRGAGSSGAI